MSELESLVEDLRKIASKIPGLPSPYPLEVPRFGPGCCRGELEELQEAFKGQLPEDYIEFLSLCRRVSAADVFNGYFLYSPLSVSREPRDEGVPYRLLVGKEPNLVEVRAFAVGGDGGGNQFLLSAGSEFPGHVWKWNHELPARFDGIAREGITLIAESFTGFVRRMLEDWSHFAEGDRQWPYFSG